MKLALRFLFLACSLALLASCRPIRSGPESTTTSPADRAAATPRLHATVGYLPMVTSLTHFVAESRGFYAKHGVVVTAERINTSNLLAQELISGHVDVGIELAINPLLNALVRAPGAAAIFSVSDIRPAGGFDGIVVPQDSPLHSLRDLSGKKVGVFPGSTATAVLLAVFRRQFPEVPPPECLQISPNLHLQELELRRVDALHAYEPVLTVGKLTKGFRQIAPSIYATDFNGNPIGVAALNRTWARRDPAAAAAVVAALDDAVHYIREHPAEARAIMARAVALEPALAAQMNIMPMTRSTEIDRPHLLRFLRHLRELGEIESAPADESALAALLHDHASH